MLDHVSIRVADYERSKKFYAAALAPLGYTLAMEADSGAGFRKGYIPDFWVKQGQVRRRNPWSWKGAVGPSYMSRLPGRIVPRSMPSMPLHWLPGRGTTVRPDCGLSITPTTTARSYSIPMAITLKRFAMIRSRPTCR